MTMFSPAAAMAPHFHRALRTLTLTALLTAPLLSGCASQLVAAAPDFPVKTVPAYDYPFSNPWKATVVGTPAAQRAPVAAEASIMPVEHELTVFEGRKIPEGFWYQRRLKYSELTHAYAAPVVFVIAGTGADHRAAKEVSLGRALYAAGYHVVLLPSPTHANFIVSASSNFLPGNAQQDAADLLRVIRLVRSDLKDRADLTDTYLTGYSLGAWHAAFVAEQDRRETLPVGFKKVLLLNPPMSVYNSVKAIDRMLFAGLPGGINGLDAFLDNALARLASNGGTDALDFSGDNAVGEVINAIQPSNNQLATTIGLSFRLSAANMIFTSDVMSNSGYIYPRNTKFKTTTPLNDYLAVGLRTSLLNYYNDMYARAYTAAEPGLSNEMLIERSSLMTIAPWLRNPVGVNGRPGPKIGLITNADDVILSPGEVDGLKSLFPGHAVVFPNGGHLGNVDHPTYLTTMTNFFAE